MKESIGSMRLSILLLALILFPGKANCVETTKVIIGVDAPTLSDLPLSIALKKDFYKPEAIEIVQVLFRSGPTAAGFGFRLDSI
ncbi:MAG: hypothetical protein HY695_08820 [Deltaproteobacteria bacterium]|nr:hypothetical protein [Deltaproteobacteria bacterium]